MLMLVFLVLIASGMALSNPLHGTRRAGSVGMPLPGVRIRIVDDELNDVEPGQSGELLVSGPNVFLSYWNKPEATRKTFTAAVETNDNSHSAAVGTQTERWFLTGDVVEEREGVYWIKGRKSADIIKSAGFKISALDVEQALAEHPRILEQVVVGLPDETFGERVAVVLANRDAQRPVTLADVREWCQSRVPKYQVPTALCTVPAIPRNAMGKVNKRDLIRTLGGQFVFT